MWAVASKHRLPGGLSKLKPCRLDGIDEELFCGKLTVFENRETRTGRTIDLNIVVLPAVNQKKKSEPLFDLAGGPGASSVMQQDSMPGVKNIASGTTSCASTSAAPGNQIALQFPARKRAALPERDVSSRLRPKNASRAREARGPDEIHNVHRDG